MSRRVEQREGERRGEKEGEGRGGNGRRVKGGMERREYLYIYIYIYVCIHTTFICYICNVEIVSFHLIPYLIGISDFEN